MNTAAERADTFRADRNIGAGQAEFGQPYLPLGKDSQHYVEGTDTLTVANGKHLLKAGFDLTRITVDSTMTHESAALYVFPDLAAFAAQQPDSFRQAFGIRSRSIASTRTGVFVQDHWTASPPLSLHLGLRADVATWPSALDRKSTRLNSSHRL